MFGNMFWFLVVISCTLASAEYNYFAIPQSAASEAQIKFAIENKYDDTGPGAKERETAYNTYKNLDEALLSYLDDPDTKLPEFEKAVAVSKLLNTNKYTKAQYPFLPKHSLGFAHKPSFEELVAKKGYWNFKEGIFNNRINEGRIPLLKGPVNLGFITSNPKPVSPTALYSLVYDANVRPSKPFPAPSQGDFVRGYYSLKGGDGRTKIIDYAVNHHGYTAAERSDVTK
ncbi:uncharacterized protein LOC128672558 [Plodia interpunctella]|uniref:uncharacterized protein LOC128672558 n=1 Tax=Plodia interpunctella TaxID=58824 RepID=UPI0023689FE3|nr:uncharacterized protein LOC128672558 [Plodia interpunctella]